MNQNIQPQLDWLLVKVIKPETGVVSQSDIEQTDQQYGVIAVGPGIYEFGHFIEPSVKPGAIVYVEAHSDANTPDELRRQGLDLIKAARVMAVVKGVKHG